VVLSSIPSTVSITRTASKIAVSLDGASPDFFRPAARSADHFHPIEWLLAGLDTERHYASYGMIQKSWL
jgi:hypothetical protein